MRQRLPWTSNYATRFSRARMDRTPSGIRDRNRLAMEVQMAGNLTTALQETNEITITVTGRVTGRQISVPVWFVADDGKVYLLPVHGSDSDWYKNMLRNPAMQLAADGASITATATPITDPADVRTVVEKFRAKYGADQIAAYYPKTDVAEEVDVPQ
jgi:deazaflavin-dependent oxidoreductase (nitroreductase family)